MLAVAVLVVSATEVADQGDAGWRRNSGWGGVGDWYP